MLVVLKMDECSHGTKLFIKSFLMQVRERHVSLKSSQWWSVPWLSWSQYPDLHIWAEGDQFCPCTHTSTCSRWMKATFGCSVEWWISAVLWYRHYLCGNNC